MQRQALAAFVVLVTVLATVEPGDAARGTRRQCRQTCGPRIERDCASFTRRARRACRRAILRSCRRVALDTCTLTPTTVDTTSTSTTTTTSLVPGTTPLPSTTTTPGPTTSTQLVPTTTTVPFHFGGDWTFFGDLVADTCAGDDPPFFDPEVLVSHTPGSGAIAVAVELFPLLYGTADRDGFDVDTVVFDDVGCTHTVAFAAEVTANPDLLAAALAIRIECPDEDCTLGYAGDLER